MHPRILARINAIALAREHATLVFQMTRLIDMLEDMSRQSDRFSIPTDRTREIHGKLARIQIDDPGVMVVFDQIQAHMADLLAGIMEGLRAAGSRQGRRYETAKYFPILP